MDGIKSEVNTYPDETKLKATHAPATANTTAPSTIHNLLKMVTEPLSEYCGPVRGSSQSPKLGLSRSQDDEHHYPPYSEPETHEQTFGSVSPIHYQKSPNLRLNFRKSHTCGSLFANCNCRSPPPQDMIPNYQQQQQQHQHQLASTSSIGLTHCSFNYSVSPTNTEASLSSSARHTSGIYSLSTQTSSATSGQLSRDGSMSASFDHSAANVAASISQLGSPIETQTLDTSQLAARQLYASDSTESGRKSVPPRISLTTSSATSASAVGSSSPLSTRKSVDRKAKRFFQSYSHPDTDFIFTDDNKHPSRESLVQIHVEPVIKTRGGKVEIKQPKRCSSPNVTGQVLDVAVHPDILIKISPRHSPIAEPRRATINSPLSTRSTQQRRRLLQRSHEIESGGSTSESDHSFDVPDTAAKHIKSPTSPRTKLKLEPKQAADDQSFNAAQKYFAESGILGPINTSSNLIRKTSKILQDSNVIEQIRKTSMILRGQSATSPFAKKISPSSSPTNGPSTTILSPLKFSYHSASMDQASSAMYSSPSSPKSPHTMATTCGFSPNMTTKSSGNNDDRDAHIKSLQGEMVSLKDVIKSRDAEIVKLRREIHKLKSVLQQTTNHLPIANDDLLQSPTAPPTSPLYSRDPSQLCASCKKSLSTSSDSNGSIDSNLSENYQSCNSLTAKPTTSNGSPPPVACTLAADKNDSSQSSSSDSPLTVRNGGKAKLMQMASGPVLKKQGVSGESCETSMQQSINIPIPKYDKDYRSKQLIKEAIMDNDFLKNIDASQVRELVDSMYSLEIPKGEYVVHEGEAGAHLYVSAEGEFEVVKNDKILGVMGPGKAFGELAILYNCTRTASIRVLTAARVWVLDRRVFQQIMMRTGMQRIENSVNFLRSVPLLKNLSEEVLAKIADVLEVEFYPAGTYIIRQGASGDTFFLISQGSVKVTQKLSPSIEEKEIRTLQRGDYFGEQALINEDKRTANIIAMAPGVECLTLDRDSFKHLIGDLCELKEKNYGDENRVLAMKYAESKEIFGANVKQEFPDMKLTDLEVVATLGIGGFGRVELVKAYRDNRVDTFALKCLKKRHIVDTKQEEHVFSERTIMLTCKTPFICRLYRTFRDDKYVYMLLEACMGGEIWTMLRDRGSFDENATQFIIGCVLQAFEFLHARGIIYRDLKPENLMLDERGYVKLVDFGFAKYIGNSSKTWTFCGTPEYVAPEIILNKGHDRAVDYWALGILIHELLNGTPPFTANDPMKTYNIILKGIDMIDFPKTMSRSAIQLIKRLCRDVPAERLGYQKGGIQDIKKHKWFLGFDWDGLESQLLIPPFVRPIAHATDTCYFDKFPCDPNEPPSENSGWDADF